MAVPFATGGGAIVKVASKADDVIDLGRTVDKVTDVADTVHDGTKALSQLEIPDCFVAGTTVTTSEGEKPIEKVQAGDYVWASDPETGEVGLKQVVKTFVNETTHVTKITVNGEEITSTQTHPYYVADKGWVLAKNLRAGDILVMLNGEHVVLEQVQHEILESPVVTYNFEVEDFHTYYVGENEILVHNKCIYDEIVEGVVDIPQLKYTNKVLKQMSNTADLYHGFPSMIDDMLDIGKKSVIIGEDKMKYLKIEISGSINGRSGVFEYIMDATGICNHRYFRGLK